MDHRPRLRVNDFRHIGVRSGAGGQVGSNIVVIELGCMARTGHIAATAVAARVGPRHKLTGGVVGSGHLDCGRRTVTRRRKALSCYAGYVTANRDAAAAVIRV